MKSIQDQIEALTQELRPYPKKAQIHTSSWFWYFNGNVNATEYFGSAQDNSHWRDSLFASTNKAEVEEYADCYRRLKLYQLLGKKAEKEFPLDWAEGCNGTDFIEEIIEGKSRILAWRPICVLGGVWFANESDRLNALSICGIDRSFQEKCAKFGLGGA